MIDSSEQTKKSKFQSAKGMHDVLPEESEYFEFLRSVVKSVVEMHDYRRIETPIIESREVFERGIGRESDIVEKEMFSLLKKGGEDLVLRPEYTAGVARAYVENGMHAWRQPVKLYSLGSVFRYDRPQVGHQRQFTQLNLEVIGNEKPALDAEIIQLTHRIVTRLGLEDIVVHVNSCGCTNCRPEYKQILKDYYRSHRNKLCGHCKKHYTKNPYRLLDCKEEKCQRFASGAPQAVDHLCDDCKKHFKEVLEILDELEVPYMLDNRIVRGLGYYSRTVFEIFAGDDEGSRIALGGGGRYDGLIKVLGGRQTPATGVALGVERIIAAMKKKGIKPFRATKPQIFLAQLGELAKKKSMALFEKLYENNIPVYDSFGRDSLKSQLKLAQKLQVDIALILGQKEAVDETILIREMYDGVQEIVPQTKMMDIVKRKLDTVRPNTAQNLMLEPDKKYRGRKTKKKKA